MVAAILDRPTLVLNRSWQPVGVAPVSRSLILLWNDNAHVVDPQDYRLYTWADWAELIPHPDAATTAAGPSDMAAAVRKPRHADRQLDPLRQRGVLERGIGRVSSVPQVTSLRDVYRCTPG